MSDFRSQAEIWQYLLDGGIVRGEIYSAVYKLIDGVLHEKTDGHDYKPEKVSFLSHEYFSKHVPELKRTDITTKDLLNPRLKSLFVEWPIGLCDGVAETAHYNRHLDLFWTYHHIETVLFANALGLPCYTFDDLEGSQDVG